MTCAVCDGDKPDAVFHGFGMHERCAPQHWVSDAADQREFMRRFHIWWATASSWKRAWDGLK